MTNEPQTPEMQATLPPQATLGEVVDLKMKSGPFPSSGAELTFTLGEPLPADRIALVANWDTSSQTWIPLASETSPDGKSVSAKLAHFSTYSVLDVVRNGLGGLIGVRTPPPECASDPPSWDDKAAPQFFDDLNGPVLWCATSDPERPDELEIKLKVNRGAAASITTAVAPSWVHSGLWDTIQPETWATMALSGPESLLPNPNTYFVPPTGEFDLWFTKTDVMNFWHSNRTQPLVEVDTSPDDLLAGLLYTQLSAVAPGGNALFLVTSAMAVTECTSAIKTSAGDLAFSAATLDSVAPNIGEALGAIASCLVDQSEFVAQSAARYMAARNPGLTLEDLAKKTGSNVKSIIVWARIFAAIQVLTPVVEALTDLLLNPVARQFNFQPTNQALKEYVQNSTPAVPGFPRELEGKWCSRLNPSNCFSVADEKAKYPDFRVIYSGPADDAPGATDYAFCIEPSSGQDNTSCHTAGTIGVRYFPVGVGWDCSKNHIYYDQIPVCDPDYSAAHDVSRPRIIHPPNHQQDKVYHDSEPMYLVDGGGGAGK